VGARFHVILAFCQDCEKHGGTPQWAPPLLMEEEFDLMADDSLTTDVYWMDLEDDVVAPDAALLVVGCVRSGGARALAHTLFFRAHSR
jgi:hypothetical protein